MDNRRVKRLVNSLRRGVILSNEVGCQFWQEKRNVGRR